MEITTEEHGEVFALLFSGHLDTNTSRPAESRLNDAMGEGRRKLLIDFTSLDYISSAGLRVLLSTAKKLKRSGGVMRICGMNPSVREVFDISGFSTILNLHDTPADALAAF